MFVDSDRVQLLADLAGSGAYVPPSVIDPSEAPPFGRQPATEFARGAYYFQQRLGSPLDAVRLARRMSFYRSIHSAWHPLELSASELDQAVYLASPAAIEAARRTHPGMRARRIGPGEAECAAVAVARGWRLWADDAAIIELVGALHTGTAIERTSNLLARAVAIGLLDCEDAAHLYNETFKGELGLWTRLTATCRHGQLLFATR